MCDLRFSLMCDISVVNNINIFIDSNMSKSVIKFSFISYMDIDLLHIF